MTTKTLALACAAVAALSACDATTMNGGTAGGLSGGLRTEVEIINGDTFNATWEERPSSVVRLAYDSGIALSDTRIVEIAEMMSGCKSTGSGIEVTLVGSTTSVKVPVACAPGTTPSA